MKGAIFLAEPDDPATAAAGAENPFDSLLALYLVAKSPPAAWSCQGGRGRHPTPDGADHRGL